ncbi:MULTISPECIES: hypothetical protein [Flavobacterium]|uniref:hypothetical protein n=1 Tax=Flavobacterium TaxID=237 RepID=UPI001FCB795C|nr:MULTISPECIES: hypothetical protein [Flavobacterium]UOK41629.1 hypothetical protein LZF87_09935 [Flavobacterium enshiense]
MKIGKLISILFIFTVLFLGWKTYDLFNPNYENKFKSNIYQVEDKRAELEELVKLATIEITGKNIPNNAMDLDDVDYELREKMEDLGFRSFRFETLDNCSQKYSFIFIVWEDWNVDTLNYVEIIYSPCDNETKKGFHSFDGSHIDTFGVGGNWKIYSDTDFI